MRVEQACLWSGARSDFMHEREAANAEQRLEGESAWVRQRQAGTMRVTESGSITCTCGVAVP